MKQKMINKGLKEKDAGLIKIKNLNKEKEKLLVQVKKNEVEKKGNYINNIYELNNYIIFK